MSKTTNYVKRELKRGGNFDEKLYEGVVDILRIFYEQSVNGHSTDYLLDILPKLLKGEPVKPYNGETEEEWEISPWRR